MKTLKLAAMAGALILGGMAGAHATPSYNVQVWIGAPNGTDSSTIADAAHQPTGPANASFTYNGPIDWKTTDSANLIAGFLNTASISGFSSPTYANLTDFGAASLSASHDPYASYFKITGIYSAPGTLPARFPTTTAQASMSMLVERPRPSLRTRRRPRTKRTSSRCLPELIRSSWTTSRATARHPF